MGEGQTDGRGADWWARGKLTGGGTNFRVRDKLAGNGLPNVKKWCILSLLTVFSAEKKNRQ